jgi:hypothetical protein
MTSKKLSDGRARVRITATMVAIPNFFAILLGFVIASILLLMGRCGYEHRTSPQYLQISYRWVFA